PVCALLRGALCADVRAPSHGRPSDGDLCRPKTCGHRVAAATTTQHQGCAADSGGAEVLPALRSRPGDSRARRLVLADGMAPVEPSGSTRVLQPARDVEDALAQRSGEGESVRNGTAVLG